MIRCNLAIFFVFTLIFIVFCGAGAIAQQPNIQEPLDTKLPSGKSQREEILKADHERSLKDAAELVKLSEELQIELEKNDRHVLSVASIKKVEDIEKLAKRIKGRLKRF
jgi:hypothetical protein